MDRFPRIVLGFHGCEPEFADALIAGEVPIADWKPSANPWDWLGRGIYFWEHAPERARAWGKGGVVGAVIQLGTCLDLTDIVATRLLRETYDSLAETYLGRGESLPQNKGKRRELDRLVIDELVLAAAEAGVPADYARMCELAAEALQHAKDSGRNRSVVRQVQPSLGEAVAAGAG